MLASTSHFSPRLLLCHSSFRCGFPGSFSGDFVFLILDSFSEGIPIRVKIAEKVLTSAKNRRMASSYWLEPKVLFLDIYQISIQTKCFWRFEGQFFNLNNQNNDLKVLSSRLELKKWSQRLLQSILNNPEMH